jgi:hypothetical protein
MENHTYALRADCSGRDEVTDRIEITGMSYTNSFSMDSTRCEGMNGLRI